MLKGLLVRTALTLTLALPASLGWTAEYFVSPQGDDSNTGTSASAPWRSISKANRTVAPGDTVHLAGGRYLDDPIRPGRSGTAEAPIRYIAATGEPAVLSSDKVEGLKVAIDLSGRSWIIVDGIDVDGVKPYPRSGVKHFLEIKDGHHNTVTRGTFRNALGWHGVQIADGASRNRVSDNVMDMVGVYDDGTGNDYGDLIQVIRGATRNVIENNVLSRAAHNLMQVKGDYNVIRGNTFDNDWSEIIGAGAGGRNLSLMGRRNLFERNVVKNAGRSTDVDANAGMKVEGESNIVRQNFIFANSLEGITSESRGGSKLSKQNRIYHNTLYNNGGPAWGLVFYKGGDGVIENVFKNNIVVGNGGSSGGDITFKLDKNPNGVLGGSRIVGNLIAKQTAGDARLDIRGASIATLGDAAKEEPAHFVNNIEAAPTFVSSSPREPKDFALAPGSRGIDEAVPLTTTREGGSGTTIPVEDAGYFTDGFAVTLGDQVRIDGQRPARVVKVDYSAQTITVDTPVRWSAGAAVTLDYRGKAPDIGAHESGLTGGRPGALRLSSRD